VLLSQTIDISQILRSSSRSFRLQDNHIAHQMKWHAIFLFCDASRPTGVELNSLLAEHEQQLCRGSVPANYPFVTVTYYYGSRSIRNVASGSGASPASGFRANGGVSAICSIATWGLLSEFPEVKSVPSSVPES
jgi:hypothetical protein